MSLYVKVALIALLLAVWSTVRTVRRQKPTPPKKKEERQ